MCIDTVGELIEVLEGIDADTPIKLALQPNYPMNGRLLNVCLEHQQDDEDVVWLACSDNEGYGVPRDAWENAEIFDESDNDEEDNESDEDEEM